MNTGIRFLCRNLTERLHIVLTIKTTTTDTEDKNTQKHKLNINIITAFGGRSF